jgi:hypothetical protein
MFPYIQLPFLQDNCVCVKIIKHLIYIQLYIVKNTVKPHLTFLWGTFNVNIKLRKVLNSGNITLRLMWHH